MRKIKEVLRLRWGLGLGLRQIERSCLISRATVSDYLQRAEQAGFSWPLPEDLDDQELERRLFKSPFRDRHCGERSQSSCIFMNSCSGTNI